MSDYDVFLKELRDQSWFQDFVAKELKPLIPPVLEYNPEDPATDDPDKWKYRCGVRAGYLLALASLGIDLKDQT